MGILDEVQVPNGVNTGLTSPSAAFLTSVIGAPKVNGAVNPVLQSLVRTESVGPFQANGLQPAVASLRATLQEVAVEAPDVYAALSSDGMLVQRFVDGTTIYSNHSWGVAVDLKLNGILDDYGDGLSLEGLARIAPIFNRHGWYWGATFPKEDSMHFEVSQQKINTWDAAGLFDKKLIAGTVAGETLSGTQVAEVIIGYEGSDNIYGAAQDDNLFGDFIAEKTLRYGNDLLDGGEGNDRLTGGAGNDKTYGGPGNDTYGFALNDGTDIVFDQGRSGEEDVLEIYGTGVTTNTQNLLFSRVGGDDLRVDVLDWQGKKHGSVTIQDMDNPANQVETLVLMGADETKIADVYLPGVFDRQSSNNPPWLQATTGSKSVNVGQLADVNTLWKASDSDLGDAVNWWAFLDSNAGANTGRLEIKGAPFWVDNGGTWQQDADGGIAPAGQWVMVTDQAYRAGAVDYVDRTTVDVGEWVYGLANDGEMWSNMTAMWLV